MGHQIARPPRFRNPDHVMGEKCPGIRTRVELFCKTSSRVVSVWFGLPNMNGIQPDSLERWSVQVERNMSKGVLVPRNT